MKVKMNTSDLATVKELFSMYKEIGDNLAERIKQTKESIESNASADSMSPYLCDNPEAAERCIRDIMKETERKINTLDKIRSANEEEILRGYIEVVDYIHRHKPCSVYDYRAVSERKRVFVDSIYDLLKPYNQWQRRKESFCKELWKYEETELFLTKLDLTNDDTILSNLREVMNKTNSDYDRNHPYRYFYYCVNEVAKAICQVLLRSLTAPKIGFLELTGDKRNRPVRMTKKAISMAMEMIYIKATRKDGRLSRSYGDVIYRLVKYGNQGVDFMSWPKYGITGRHEYNRAIEILKSVGISYIIRNESPSGKATDGNVIYVLGRDFDSLKYLFGWMIEEMQ